MESFLDKIAGIINCSDIPETGICVVFPNRRAGTFLKRKLVPVGAKPRWLPSIQSIEDFVFGISKMQEPDNTSQLTLLYKAHCHVSEAPVSFDNFLSWGSEVLKDFEEVDQYLADADDLFANLGEARETEIWKPGEEMTDFEKNYLRFYKSLTNLYHAYKEILVEKRLAFQGMATRMIAEDLNLLINNVPWKKIIFAGFNALTPAQLIIVKHLIQSGKAEIIFDVDTWYLNDAAAEAGSFLRKHQTDKQLGEFKEITTGIADPDKRIYTCGVTGKIGQARTAGSILNMIPEEKHSATAIVLADESMLIPVLHALPKQLGNYNVTMGFPIAQSPAYGLADSILQMHVNARNASGSNPAFYHADVTTVLQDNVLHRILQPEKARIIINSIKKDNYSYITLKEIMHLAGVYENAQGHPFEEDINASENVFKLIFSGNTEPVKLLHSLLILLEQIRKSIYETDKDNTEEEILFTLYQKIAGLYNSLKKENIYIESLITLSHFFRETVSGVKVPFYGEPLKGIQVMGMLETRVLDFENIILLSANEDILPSAKSNRSFIPADIRRHHGLPTHNERQAVYAYHFYHLLQRCKSAWLLYNNDADMPGGGEMSRYLRQLIWEFPKKGLQIYTLGIKEARPVSRKLKLSIPKTADIMERLYTKAAKGFSFSSLRQYINCSLSFYFTYVLKLEETEQVEEEITSRTMGTILHAILEDLYKPSLGGFPDQNTLQQAIDNTEDVILQKTATVFPALKVESGRNLLFLKVAETWLKRFLKYELDTCKAGCAPEIKGIEHEISRDIVILTEDTQELPVRLYAMIDRLDVTGGVLRVIDYKTGNMKESDVFVKNAEDMFTSAKKFEKSLQLSFYKYIVQSNPAFNVFDIQPGIISFKSLGKGFIPLKTSIDDDQFELHLKGLLQEIFNTSINFEQAEETKCKFCNFKAICNRIAPEW